MRPAKGETCEWKDNWQRKTKAEGPDCEMRPVKGETCETKENWKRKMKGEISL